MTAGRRFAAIGVAVSLGAVIAALSRVPYTPVKGDHALVKLSWRYRGEPVTDCRAVSPEERSRMPAHMRRDTVCSGRLPPHRLKLFLDGTVVEDVLLEPGGAHGDRPIAVYRELQVQPGMHDLRIHFGAEGAGASDTDDLDARFSLRLVARQVALITYDPERDALVQKP